MCRRALSEHFFVILCPLFHHNYNNEKISFCFHLDACGRHGCQL